MDMFVGIVAKAHWSRVAAHARSLSAILKTRRGAMAFRKARKAAAAAGSVVEASTLQGPFSSSTVFIQKFYKGKNKSPHTVKLFYSKVF